MRAIPEQGQLVDVRQRRYVVTEVARTSLPSEVLPIAYLWDSNQHDMSSDM